MTPPGHATATSEKTEDPRKIAEDIKKNARKLLEEEMHCIVDFQDLRDLVNTSSYSPNIPHSKEGEEFVCDELGLRKSSLETIKGLDNTSIICVEKDEVKKLIEEITLSFYITRNRNVGMPSHEAFPDDPKIRRKLNRSFGKITGWLS